VQQQTLPAAKKLGDADTSELIAGAYTVVHVWKTLLNAIRAKALAKQGSRRAAATAGARPTAGRAQGYPAARLAGQGLRPR
jgi:hypothetical protein